MPTQSKTPGTFATVTRSTTDEQDWGDEVSDVQTDDTNYLICVPWVPKPDEPELATSTEATESYFAVLTNFEFDIPSNAVGIALSAQIKKGIQDNTDGGNIQDAAVQLWLVSTISDNKAIAEEDWTYPHTTSSYTGPWGVEITRDLLNDSGFGIAIACKGVDGPLAAPPYINEGPAQGEIDLVTLIVTYNLSTGASEEDEPDYEPPVFPPDTGIPDEPEDSPFYGQPPYIVKAAKPKDLRDAWRGRICTKTGMWVPGHRLKWVSGKPYLDTVAVYPGEPMPNPVMNTPSE